MSLKRRGDGKTNEWKKVVGKDVLLLEHGSNRVRDVHVVEVSKRHVKLSFSNYSGKPIWVNKDEYDIIETKRGDGKMRKIEEIKEMCDEIKRRLDELDKEQLTSEDAKKDIEQEVKMEKVKTGIARLDDLLYGGFPIGSQVLVNSPEYVGEDILIYNFIAEGLKKGIPALFILTDKSIEEIQEQMTEILPNYADYENAELTRYIDIRFDTKSIMEEIDEIEKDYKKHPYYRIAFLSLTSLIRYYQMDMAFKFLQELTAKRRRANAVGLYLITKGLHSESEMQMIKHTMEGIINFKIEDTQFFLRVEGICDVQTRAWIGYRLKNGKLDLGTFSSDYIGELKYDGESE